MNNNNKSPENPQSLDTITTFLQQQQPSLSTRNNICKNYMHSTCRTHPCKFSHDLSQAQSCKQFQKDGFCPKGNSCDFLHRNNQHLRGLLVCQKFLQDNYCPQNKNCPYKHAKILCRNFQMGFCQHGVKCREVHQQQQICANYAMGFCPQGPFCESAHPKVFNGSDLQAINQLTNLISVRVCKRCEQIGHLKKDCQVEVVFNDVPTQQGGANS